MLFTLKIIFWSCIFIVFYTYIGYGILLWILVKLKNLRKNTSAPAPLQAADLPDVTLMICAYNEQDIVEMKMENCRQINYPQEKLSIMWVTDGSTDQTNEKLSKYANANIIYSPERKGKTAALNHGISMVETAITIMTDANTMLNNDAILEIVKCFQDPQVACVAGEKRVLARHQGQTAAEGEGLYWKYESTLKRLDYELYSAMGAAGELCAIRTNLYQPMPEDTLLDDFIMSLIQVDNGYKIAYTSNAYAMEYGSANFTEEAKRKRRIAAGGLQSIWRLRRMLNPFKHPLVAFQFISHRVLRWSLTPIAMFLLIPINVTLVFMKAGLLYDIIWILQLLFYTAAIAGYIQATRNKNNYKLLNIPFYFMFMNINVFRGMKYLAQHQNNGAWEKAKRG